MDSGDGSGSDAAESDSLNAWVGNSKWSALLAFAGPFFWGLVAGNDMIL